MQVGRNLLAFVRDRTIGLCETSRKTFSGVRSAARRLASRSLVWLKRMGPIGWIICVFSTALIFEVFAARSTVQIDPFIVPKTFDEQGYTSQAIVNRVIDRISTMQDAVKTARTRIEQYQLSTPDLPDVEIDAPATKLSFRAVVRFVQEAFHLEPPHVSGEITIVLATKSVAQHLLVTARVTRKDEHRSVRFDVTPAEADAVVSPLAEQILQLVNPYLLATYVYGCGCGQNPTRTIALCRLALQQDPTNADVYSFVGYRASSKLQRHRWQYRQIQKSYQT